MSQEERPAFGFEVKLHYLRMSVAASTIGLDRTLEFVQNFGNIQAGKTSVASQRCGLAYRSASFIHYRLMWALTLKLDSRKFAAVAHRLCGLGCMIAVSLPGATKELNDWSRVQSLPHDRHVVVKPFEGSGEKVNGRLVRVDDRSITIQTRVGEVEVTRASVRVVAVRDRTRHNAPWIGAAIGFGVLAAITAGTGDLDQPAAALAFGAAGAGLGALGGLTVRALAGHAVVYRVETRRR